MSALDIAAVGQAVAENRYLITRHAQQRTGLRKITHEDLKYVVRRCLWGWSGRATLRVLCI